MRGVTFLILILMVGTALLLSQTLFEPSLMKKSQIEREINKKYSENHEFFGEFRYGSGTPEYVPYSRFALKTKSGDEIYEKSPFPHTIFDISNNGEVVGIDYDGPMSGSAVLHFYNTAGVEIGTNSIDFLLDRSFSSESNVYCINDGKKGLRIFKLNGEELFNLGICNWFSVSFDGKYVAAARDTEIILFDNGEQMSTIPLASSFIREIKFSEDGSLLGYIDKKSVSIYSINEQKIITHYEEKNKKRKLVSFDIAPDNSIVIVGIDEDRGKGTVDRHNNGFVYLFSLNGELNWEGEIPYGDSWNAFIPKVIFTGVNTFKINTVNESLEYQF